MAAPIVGPPRARDPPHLARESAGWRGVRATARTLMALWAVFCSLGVIGDVLATTPDATGIERLLMIGGGVLLLAALAALPWRWEAVGGTLLVLVGMVVSAQTVTRITAGGFGTDVLVAGGVIGFVPLLAGVLFVAHAWATRSR